MMTRCKLWWHRWHWQPKVNYRQLRRSKQQRWWLWQSTSLQPTNNQCSNSFPHSPCNVTWPTNWHKWYSHPSPSSWSPTLQVSQQWVTAAVDMEEADVVNMPIWGTPVAATYAPHCKPYWMGQTRGAAPHWRQRRIRWRWGPFHAITYAMQCCSGVLQHCQGICKLECVFLIRVWCGRWACIQNMPCSLATLKSPGEVWSEQFKSVHRSREQRVH